MPGIGPLHCIYALQLAQEISGEQARILHERMRVDHRVDGAFVAWAFGGELQQGAIHRQVDRVLGQQLSLIHI